MRKFEEEIRLKEIQNLEQELISKIPSKEILEELIELQPKIIPVLGAPGAGKTIMLNYFNNEYDVQTLETGKLFKKDLKKYLTINEWKIYNKLRKEYSKQNKILPDELAISFFNLNLLNEIKKQKIQPEKNLFINGYPRMKDQAINLMSITKIEYLFNLYLTKYQSLKRQIKRSKKYGRKDEINFENRYYNYEENILPTVQYLLNNNPTIKLIEIKTGLFKTKEEGLKESTKIFKEHEWI